MGQGKRTRTAGPVPGKQRAPEVEAIPGGMEPNGKGGPAGGGAGFQYPLQYSLKVIGLAADDFPEHARALVERAAGAEVVEPPTVRASGGGRYLSVTVVVRLDSEPQRLAVYAALRADERVVYAL